MFEAKRYEGKVRAGNILISVHTQDAGDIARAKDIFLQAGAQDICTGGAGSTPKDSRATGGAALSGEPALSGAHS